MKIVSSQDFYFLTVIALFATVGVIPSRRFKFYFADHIGAIAYHWSRQKRQRSEENVRRVMALTLTQTQVRQIVRASFREFWRDHAALWFTSAERAKLAPTQIEGWEHLQTALQSGNGAILLESSFFGSRNLAKQLLCELGMRVHQAHDNFHLGGFLMHEMTWVQKNITRPILEQREKQFVAKVIYLPAAESLAFTKQLLSVLQKKSVLSISADGDVGRKQIPAQFLGRTEWFPTGVWSLGKISGAPLLPFFCMRLQSGELKLIIERPLAFSPTLGREQALEEILTRYLERLETYIQEYPAQYRNWQFFPRGERRS